MFNFDVLVFTGPGAIHPYGEKLSQFPNMQWKQQLRELNEGGLVYILQPCHNLQGMICRKRSLLQGFPLHYLLIFRKN